MLVLACDVPPHGVVARKRARAERTRDADALVPLPDVSAQIRLVAVEAIAVQAFQFFACARRTRAERVFFF